MRKRLLDRFFFGTALLLISWGNCWILVHNPLNSDIAWYLRLGHEMLGGKRLYQDYFETNPPLAALLHVIPVWIAGVIGASAQTVWVVLTTLVILGFCGAAARLWGLAWQSGPGKTSLTFLFLSVITLVYLFGFDFGQRDHLGCVASLVLAMLLACRLRQAPITKAFVWTLSVLAGCVLAIKPFFLVPWLLCLAYAGISLGWRTLLRLPETWIATAVALLQVPIVLFVTPGYIRLLLLLSHLYSRFDEKSLGYLLRQPLILIPLAGIACILIIYRPSERSVRTIRMAGVLTIGWIISGLLQRKGWSYHLRPGEAGLCFTAWLVGLDIAERRAFLKGMPRLAWAAAVSVVLCLAAARFMHVRWQYPAYVDELGQLLARQAPARVLMVSTAMLPVSLLEEDEIGLANHYLHLWQIPALYAGQIASGKTAWRYHTLAEMGPEEKDMLDRTYEDLAGKPDLVVFGGETEQGMGRLRVDLRDYLRQDPAIATLLDCYRLLPGTSYYRVYRRLPRCAAIQQG